MADGPRAPVGIPSIHVRHASISPASPTPARVPGHRGAISPWHVGGFVRVDVGERDHIHRDPLHRHGGEDVAVIIRSEDWTHP
jgi:hypothetical protein